MEDHAAGLAEAFALDSDVTVFTKLEYADVEFSDRYAVRPILTGRAIPDVQRLKHERMDRWLTLNAAYSWLSRHVDAPVFAYCHGNDFLKPWTDTYKEPERAFVSLVGKLPYCWRFQPRAERKLKHARIALGLARARMIFVNSRKTKQALLAAFPTIDTPIAISWPGVAEVFFETPCSAVPPSSHTGLRLVTVARLCRGKNIGNVLRALATLKAEIDFTYAVVGDGDLRAELECMARDLQIDERVRFHGSLSSSGVIANLDASDLLVLPSLSESFGIVYAEAAARGLPSLASRIGGAMDAVVENINGIFVGGPEPEQIAQGIRRFSRMQPRPNPQAIRQFALQFRRRIIAAQLKGVVSRSA
jgi:glycosyltransferase involved in cell wall biosynthesis